MSIKAKLKIVLQADDTVVAEIENTALWQKVLTTSQSLAATQSLAKPSLPEIDEEEEKSIPESVDSKKTSKIEKLLALS